MKKKFLAMIMAGVMAAALLTACGGGSEETAAVDTAVEETAEDTAEDTADTEDAGDMVSDETFEILQDNYATMVEAYNAVAELYSSDEIAADADIEDTMNKAADVINQMGEITQDSMTEADAEDLNSAMVDILDALSMLVDGMQEADGAADAEAADGAVSDETFAILQDNFKTLSDAYDIVADYYMSDEVEADADIEDILNQTADVINEMGEISQDTITEEDAVTLNDTMLSLMDSLQTIVDAM